MTPAIRTLTVPERYVALALALGEHVDGLTFFYGDERPARRERSDLLAEAIRLLGELGEVAEEPRRRWLKRQVPALRAVAADEALAVRDEARVLYGLEPEPWPDDVFAEAHRLLDEALPGNGDLGSRYRSWVEACSIPGDKVVPILRAAAGLFRERTRDLVGLPDGEDVEIELVTGERWRGFSRYLGGLKSRFSYNGEFALPASEVALFVSHEAYPGHHTENAWKDALLVRRDGRVELKIVLAVGVQPVLVEGAAQVATDLVEDEAAHRVVAAAACEIGCDYDAEVGFRVATASRPLSAVSANVALMYDDGATRDELLDYVRTWSLQPEDRIRRTVDAIERSTFRASVFCYTEGHRLCSAYVGGDPRRFERLLKEQLTLEDLNSRSGLHGSDVLRHTPHDGPSSRSPSGRASSCAASR
jgi:hypothetical protein